MKILERVSRSGLSIEEHRQWVAQHFAHLSELGIDQRMGLALYKSDDYYERINSFLRFNKLNRAILLSKEKIKEERTGLSEIVSQIDSVFDGGSRNPYRLRIYRGLTFNRGLNIKSIGLGFMDKGFMSWTTQFGVLPEFYETTKRTGAILIAVLPKDFPVVPLSPKLFTGTEINVPKVDDCELLLPRGTILRARHIIEIPKNPRSRELHPSYVIYAKLEYAK